MYLYHDRILSIMVTWMCSDNAGIRAEGIFVTLLVGEKLCRVINVNLIARRKGLQRF